jgi:hypothetical protein
VSLRFEDVAEEVGLKFTHTDGGSGRHFFVEQIGSGCALVDLDGDGLLDLFALCGAPLPGYKGEAPRHRLWKGEPGGKFTEATDSAGVGSYSYGTGVCVADFDNDGKPDIYVTCYGKNLLYRNLGSMKFEEVGEKAGVAGAGILSTSAAFFDYDNDGFVDLYVGHYVKWTLKEDRWCGANKDKKSYCGPEVYPAQLDTLYRNNGDGTFKDVTLASKIACPSSKTLGMVATDVDNDGWIDLYCANDLVPNLLFINNRDGTFSERGVAQAVAFGQDGGAESGMGVTAGDYDGDGRMDLFVTNYSYEMYALYRNTTEGQFEYDSVRAGVGQPTLLPLGFGTRFSDLDLDGHPDLVMANGHVLDDCKDTNAALEYAQTMQFLRNLDGRRFQDVSAQAGPAFLKKYVGRGLAVGDYDNDGKPDVAVNNVNGPLRLIHNLSESGNHWIGLSLRGTTANRSAIGARVTVRAGGKSMEQEVVSGSSYLSQSDLRLQFGLGSSETVEEIVVRWPGSGGKPGAEQHWSNLTSNSYYSLEQGVTDARKGTQ